MTDKTRTDTLHELEQQIRNLMLQDNIPTPAREAYLESAELLRRYRQDD